MFDHIKRVKGWATMACHVYHTTFCCAMTIAVCNMESEDVTVQLVFWKNLNVVMARHNLRNPKFKDFMAESTQANWNVVWIIYNSGDASFFMEEKKRTCLFYWTEFLEKHTKANIRADP